MTDQGEISQAELVRALIGRRKPRLLYHYTSASALIGILESRTIWATGIRFLNDTTEYNFALSVAREVIQRLLDKASNKFDFGLYTVLLDAVTRGARGDVYVSSFTENPDQLSQWRAYCPPSGGYSLGFRSKLLVPPNSATSDCFLTRCVYDWEGRQKLIRDLIRVVADFAEEKVHARLEHDRIFRESFKLLWRLLPLVAPSLKDPSFEEEHEWRLVRSPASFDEPSHFRVGRSMIIPFHQHRLVRNNEKVPIEEIIIGPTPHPHLARESAQALLSSYGLQTVAIKMSSIPYRAW